MPSSLWSPVTVFGGTVALGAGRFSFLVQAVRVVCCTVLPLYNSTVCSMADSPGPASVCQVHHLSAQVFASSIGRGLISEQKFLVDAFLERSQLIIYQLLVPRLAKPLVLLRPGPQT
jgi:hypothetical protein